MRGRSGEGEPLWERDRAMMPLVLPLRCVRRWRPAPALCAWVDHYWQVQGPARRTSTGDLRYPDGGVTLVIDGLDGTRPSVRWEIARRPVAVPAVLRGATLGIRFRPGGASQLFGQSLDALDELDDRGGCIGWHALPEVLPALGPADRLRWLEAWLMARAETVPRRLGHVLRLLPLLDAGRFSIARVVEQGGLSRRTLERDFRRQVGLSPAQLERLQRLGRARRLLVDPELTVSRIAQDCGFHDQAHFTHQFRRLGGETPTAYRRRKLTQIYKA